MYAPIAPSPQFGFDGDDLWIRRRETLFADLHSNSKAKFVTRVVQFGSEPLFDGVMSPKDLTAEVVAAKARLSSLRIPITVSEMAFGYQRWGGAPDVLDAVDFINIHMLPFFAQAASVGEWFLVLIYGSYHDIMLSAKASWPLVQADLNWFIAHGNGKKMYFDEVRHWQLCPFFPDVRDSERLAVRHLPRSSTQQS
jgi:hypothetical protein